MDSKCYNDPKNNSSSNRSRYPIEVKNTKVIRITPIDTLKNLISILILDQNKKYLKFNIVFLFKNNNSLLTLCLI